MSAHTPGPWVVLRDPSHGGPLVATEDVAIADVMEMEAGMSEANANLIAAAPDLLAEAKKQVELLRVAHLAVSPGLLAAIAKAEGQS